jgi:hypothetical protein
VFTARATIDQLQLNTNGGICLAIAVTKCVLKARKNISDQTVQTFQRERHQGKFIYFRKVMFF